MKKLLTTGVIVFAVVGLSACSSQNGAAAKKAYLSDTLALNNKAYNVQDVSLKINSFKETGNDAKQANQLLDGANFDFKIDVDNKNKTAQLAGAATVAKKNYHLDAILGNSGLYLNSADLKTLYNNNKTLLNRSSKDSAPIYDAMVKSLTTPYFLIDEQTMDAGVKNSGTTWQDSLSQIFNRQSVSKAKLTKAFKEIPDRNFTQSGHQVTLTLSGKNGDLADVLKGASSVNSSLSKAELKKALKELKTDASIQSMNVTTTIDTKEHRISAVLSGKAVDKKEPHDAVSIKMTLSSKVSKSAVSITEPEASQVKTIQDLEQSAILAIEEAQQPVS